jgi:cytochrome c oxidase assembly protein subunit 11
MDVHPGKMYFATFTATNRAATDKVAQAVPSVAPVSANKYFKKIECFCFTSQEFAANEARPLPLQFIVDPGLPDYVDTITLSYTLFDTENTYVTRTR